MESMKSIFILAIVVSVFVRIQCQEPWGAERQYVGYASIACYSCTFQATTRWTLDIPTDNGCNFYRSY